jgi:hypothetical protein
MHSKPTSTHFALLAPLCLAFVFRTTLVLAAPDNSAPKESSSDGDPNKDRREWMNKGNAEYVQKHWEAARDCYIKAWDIKHHFTIAANLADVEMKMSHYAEAVGYLKYVLANVPEGQADKRKAAEDQLTECRNHLTAVRVAVDVTNATVLVDGRDVGQTPLREDLLLEPGKHVISVTKPGYGNQTQELSAEGNQVDVTLTLEKPGPAPTPTPAIPASQVDHSVAINSHSDGYRIASFISFGVGLVGVGAGTFFLIRAHSTQSDSDAEYNGCWPNCSAAKQQHISSVDVRALHQRTESAVSFIVGGVGLATGVTLLLLEPKKPATTSAAYVRPWVGAGQAGLFGTF